MTAFASLTVGCDRSDSKLKNQLIGRWAREDWFEMNLAANERFHSKYIGKEKEMTFAGTWIVKTNCLILTITEKNFRNFTNQSPAVGDVECIRILSVAEDRLVTEASGQTNTLVRKSQSPSL